MDYIFINGKILTMTTGKQPEAVLVKGNKIHSLGSLHTLNKVATNPEIIDLHGNTLMPAMTDAHTHFVATAMHQMTLDVSGCQTEDEFYKRMVDYRDNQESMLKGLGAEASPATTAWVQGFGWQKGLVDKYQNINNRLIDKVFPDIPVSIASKDLHANLVNSKVLEIINNDCEILQYKQAPRYSDGFLGEHSWTLLSKYRPDLNKALQKQLINRLINQCAKYGLCGVHSLEPLPFAKIVADISHDANFYFIWYYQDLNTNKVPDFDYKSLFLPETEHFRNAGIKIFSDGALGSDTAWMLCDFNNKFEVKHKDYLNEIMSEMLAAYNQNIQFAVHVIGDLAVYMIASAVKRLNGISAKNPHIQKAGVVKHRLEHLQAVNPKHIQLLKEANIHASMQPVHLKTDIELIKEKWKQAKEYSFPLKSISQHVELALGSDSPVETLNPFEGVRWAVNRNGFLEHEAISLEEALISYTYKHHIIANKKVTYGMIKKNQIANLIVIHKETFNDMNSFINETELTMINGKIIHRK